MKNKIKNEKNIIICPNCKSTFDVSGYFNKMKKDFIEKLGKVVEDLKEERKDGTKKNNKN